MKTNIENFTALQNHLDFISKVNECTTFEAIKVYKKLCRIEKRVNRLFTADCNGTSNLTEEEEDKRDGKILQSVNKLVKIPGIFLNGDPRGYSLKIKPETVSELNEKHKINIYTDWGGYGILAPEF